MLILRKLILVLSTVSSFIVPVISESTPNQRVAEGQYARMNGGQIVEGATQTWVLWQVPGGFLLEDHFQLQPDATAKMLAGLGSKRLSPQLRKKMEAEATANELQMRFSSEFRPQQLVVRGNRVLDGRNVEIVRCDIQHLETLCRGLKGQTRLRSKSPREFFYSFPFPMLFTSLLRQQGSDSERGKMDLIALSSKNTRSGPELSESEGKVKYVGQETVSIGDRNPVLGKYEVTIVSSSGWLLKAILWVSDGLVMALERPAEEERLELIQYKKYADF